MRTRRKRIVVTSIIAAVLLLIISSYFSVHPAPLWGAQSVEAYQVLSEPQYEEEYIDKGAKPHWPLPGASIDGMHIINGPVQMDSNFARRVNMAILAPTAFNPDASSCLMQTGFVFRVKRGNDFMDCLLCFHCGQMIAQHGAKEWYGSLGAGFANLVKEAFPKVSLGQR